MRAWWLVAVVLLMSSETHGRDVTHEDIRDAMMSLVHIVRATEDKLERHELREKALGEQLKKMMTALDKKQRNLETLKGTISRLDDRLYNVENLFLEKEQREKETQNKTHGTLEDIQKSLKSLTEMVTSNLKPKNSATEMDNNLTTNEDPMILNPIRERLDSTDTKLDAIKMEIEKLKNTFNKDTLQATCLEVASEMNPFERHMSETEKLLNKYELKLNEYNETASKVQTDFVPLSEVSLADEAWHSNMTDVMDRQAKDIGKIRQLLSDAESMWKDLPRLADIKRATNYTLQGIAELQSNVTDSVEKGVANTSMKVRELGDRLESTNEDIQQSLTQGNTMSESAFNDLHLSYNTLRQDLQALTKNKHVMLQISDDVTAIKKRIEFNVHEIREVIKMKSNLMNKTMKERFDGIETFILDSQSGNRKALSDKIEGDMSQVWRQMGIVYTQVTASKQALDKLSELGGQYFNRTTSKLDSIKETVSDITTRMAEGKGNLNHLLGRISIVAQEFKHIKNSLGIPPDNSKVDIAEDQAKLNDTNTIDYRMPN